VPEPQPVRNERFKWYILHAYSGFERKVRESIESRIEAFGVEGPRGPSHDSHRAGDARSVNGKKRTVERVFLPGYGAGGDGARQPSLARVERHAQGDRISWARATSRWH